MSQRLLRGGSWIFLPRYLRSAYRLRDNSDNRFIDSGFRLAKGTRQMNKTPSCVLRGGSWGVGQDLARADFRNLNRPGFRYGSFGFRVAKNSSTQGTQHEK
jgi:formylglycine-generating enzyme required for sulfatase activity